MHDAELIGLEELGIVRLRGPDLVRFLQGQLSADVEKLTPERSLLGGYHNPQGRAIALLRLLQLDAEDCLAVVPRELAAIVVDRLSRYILRAKVKIAAELASWRISGLVLAGSGQLANGLPAALHAQSRLGDCVLTQVGRVQRRWLLACPAGGQAPEWDFEVRPAETAVRWHRLEVADGFPQIHAATSEQFVAQMLNLDAIGAIAFDKGCYTGQEVIARAHYRGRVKRRMQRFITHAPALLSPGDSGHLADGRSFRVVLAARLEDGRCDFLAVAAMPGSAGSTGEAEPAGSGPAPAQTAILMADPAPLPYSLPE